MATTHDEAMQHIHARFGAHDGHRAARQGSTASGPSIRRPRRRSSPVPAACRRRCRRRSDSRTVAAIRPSPTMHPTSADSRSASTAGRVGHRHPCPDAPALSVPRSGRLLRGPRRVRAQPANAAAPARLSDPLPEGESPAPGGRRRSQEARQLRRAALLPVSRLRAWTFSSGASGSSVTRGTRPWTSRTSRRKKANAAAGTGSSRSYASDSRATPSGCAWRCRSPAPATTPTTPLTSGRMTANERPWGRST